MKVRSVIAKVLLGACLVAGAGLTRIPNSPPAPQTRALFNRFPVPPPVRHSIESACADCHSSATVWPWYAHLPVVSYLLERDVKQARAHMDLSDWQKVEERGPEELAAGFSGICENLLSGAMPKHHYLWMHPTARLSKAQISEVCEWTDKQQMAVLKATRQ